MSDVQYRIVNDVYLIFVLRLFDICERSHYFHQLVFTTALLIASSSISHRSSFSEHHWIQNQFSIIISIISQGGYLSRWLVRAETCRMSVLVTPRAFVLWTQLLIVRAIGRLAIGQSADRRALCTYPVLSSVSPAHLGLAGILSRAGQTISGEP